MEEGNITAAAAHLKDLARALRDTQPQNAPLALRLCKPISRLACGDTSILSQTLSILQRVSSRVGVGGPAGAGAQPPAPGAAAASSDTEAGLALEIARQQLLSGALVVLKHSSNLNTYQ